MKKLDQIFTEPRLSVQERVIADVLTERLRQDAKWGPQNHHPFQWRSILGEECGEVDKAVNEANWGKGEWQAYRDELIQVAAVAIAAIEDLDRHGGEPGLLVFYHDSPPA